MKRRIGILTCLWKRAALERIVLDWHGQMSVPGVELVMLAVGSEGDASRERAESAGWNYIAARNRPLSDKHNKGMKWFQDKMVAAVIVIGSDDLMTAETVAALVDAMDKGGDVVQQEDLYYYDPRFNTLHYGVRHHPGGGQLYAAGALDKVDWQPWPEGAEDKLDGKASNVMHHRAHPCKFRFLDKGSDRGLMLVDIKTGQNIWDFAHIRSTTGRVTPAEVQLFDDAFPGVRDRLIQSTEGEDNG